MTVLIDTSVWADHLRSSDADVLALLSSGAARMHPFVLGELALGNLRDWRRTVAKLRLLPAATIAASDDVITLIADLNLAGSGLGYIDTHLLASASAGSHRLWTRDRRLRDRAERLEIAWLA